MMASVSILEMTYEEVLELAVRQEDEIERLNKEIGELATGNLAAQVYAGKEIRRLQEWVEEFAAEPCTYGDGCPLFDTRHGRCFQCKARTLLQEGA